MTFQSQCDLTGRETASVVSEPFLEPHYPVVHWAKLWGFSAKTIREWFRDEFGLGILRQQNSGRRKQRDFTTMMISPTAARRVYLKRTKADLIH